ncbi:TPA: hypothetical protein NQN63_000189 [Legionella pneumophila]|nr:hypothetical protein [Legionella pneumophila]HCJ1112864.1 hypothetical protein [Legionella pneumophila]
MTVLVGINCKDGVVIGADSSATSAMGQYPLIEMQTKKIDIINDKIIVAGTGQVGLGQRFKSIVKNAWDQGVFKHDHVEVGRQLSQKALTDFGSTQAVKGSFGALVAFCCKKQVHLCEFPSNDFQPEFKETSRLWYVAMGSGQALAEPFLAFIRDVFWEKEIPSIQDGIFAAYWTLSHTIQLNAGGINGPINIATLRCINNDFQAKIFEEEELAEHKENISAIKSRLREYRQEIIDGKTDTEIPS